MQEIIEAVKNWHAIHGLNIIGAILILVVGKIITGILRNVLEKGLKKSNLDQTIVSFLGNLLYGLLITLVVLVALGQVGVETTSFIAIVGAAVRRPV